MHMNLAIHDFWVDQTKGSKQNVWLKSHVCLSRNLNGFPFSEQATSEQKNVIVAQIQKAIESLPEFNENFVSFDWCNCSAHEKSLFRTLFNLENPCDETRIWLNTKEKYWCVSNDGDHLRLHIGSQLWNIKSVWKKLDAFDSQLERTLLYIFEPEKGYATCRPETYGMGLLITAIMHLPGLCFVQKLPTITEAFNEMALSINAQQLVNTKPLGHLFAVENKTALGCTEVELINHMEQLMRHLVDVEMRTRCEVFQHSTNFLKDSIGRSLGLLKNCFELNFEESVNLLSLIRMAIDLGIINGIKPESLSALWNVMHSNDLKEFCPEGFLIRKAENCIRADVVRSFFSKISKLSLNERLKEVSYVS